MKRLIHSALAGGALAAAFATAAAIADRGPVASAAARYDVDEVGGARSSATQVADVFVVSTLYRRHETVAAYSLDALGALIADIDPHVLVLDVTPAELAAHDVHASKIEYRDLVFPLLRSTEYRVYPAEPDEPLFSEIVQPVAARRATMQRTDPDRMDAWRAWDAATYDLLAQMWHGPGDVNGPFTDSVMRTRHAIEIALFGAADRQDHERWNAHYASVVRRAVSDNPGRRILVLVGVQNRHLLLAALMDDSALRLVDIPSWLER
jgi:hypothetical protein